MLGWHGGLTRQTQFDVLTQDHLGHPLLPTIAAMGETVIDGHCFIEDEHQRLGSSGKNSRHPVEFSAYDQVLKRGSDRLKTPCAAHRDGAKLFIGRLGVARGARHDQRKWTRDEHMPWSGDNHRTLLHGLTVVSLWSPIFNQ